MNVSGKTLFHVLQLCYVSVLIGAFSSLLGVALPDFQCVFHTSLKETSSLFLAQGASMIASCFLSVYLLKHVNLYLLMSLTMGLYTVSVALLAATSFIQVAVAMAVVAGLAFGLSLSNNIYMCNLLFAESPYAIHVISSAMSFGNLLSPIIAKPFLGGPKDADTTTQFHDTRASVTGATQVIHSSLSDTHRYLSDSESPQAIVLSNLTINTKSDNNQSYCGTLESDVKYLCVTISMLAVPVMVSFCVMFLRMDSQSDFTTRREQTTHVQIRSNTSKSEIMFIVTTTLTLPFMFGTAYVYGSYLTTFGSLDTNTLSVQKMADLTSLYWLSFFFGRLFATLLSNCVSQTVIVTSCCIGQILSVALVIFPEENKEVFMWIGSLCLAFFNGPTFGSLLTWGKQVVYLSPWVLGVWNLADFVGVTFLPYVSGNLIEKYGYDAHLFYCLGLTLLQMLLCCVLQCIGRFIERKNAKREQLVTKEDK